MQEYDEAEETIEVAPLTHTAPHEHQCYLPPLPINLLDKLGLGEMRRSSRSVTDVEPRPCSTPSTLHAPPCE